MFRFVSGAADPRAPGAAADVPGRLRGRGPGRRQAQDPETQSPGHQQRPGRRQPRPGVGRPDQVDVGSVFGRSLSVSVLKLPAEPAVSVQITDSGLQVPPPEPAEVPLRSGEHEAGGGNAGRAHRALRPPALQPDGRRGELCISFHPEVHQSPLGPAAQTGGVGGVSRPGGA